jgi:hypothetical protein
VRPGCSEGHASLLQDWLPWIQVVELEFEFVQPLEPVPVLPLWYIFWQLEILEATAGGDGVGFLKCKTIVVLTAVLKLVLLHRQFKSLKIHNVQFQCRFSQKFSTSRNNFQIMGTQTNSAIIMYVFQNVFNYVRSSGMCPCIICDYTVLCWVSAWEH